VLHPDRHPLQIGAISVAAGDRGTKWYVQNWLSNTITVIPAVYAPLPDGTLILPWESVIDEAKLAAYRDAWILAFWKMLGRFLQYLKDCFCHLLLVDCPDGTGRVYLADVSFKNGAVYQICNFSRRQYVHTFPTVEYWLSVVPIIPLVKMAVEKFCCSVLPGFFDNLKAPSRDRKATIKSSTARSSVQWGSAFKLGSVLNTKSSQLKLAGAFARMSAKEKLGRPPAGNPPESTDGVSNAEIVMVPAKTATENATRKGIVVNDVVVAEDTATAWRTFGASALSTKRVPPGSKVDLITDRSGRVLGYRTVEASRAAPTPRIAPAPRTAEPSRSEIAATRDEVASLREEVASLREAMEKLKEKPRPKPRDKPQ